MSINSLAVFCGSKEGNDPLYIEHAIALGTLLAKKNVELIYGGGGYGIMGAVANAVLQANGRAIGIMPKILTSWEKQHTNLTELYEVEDMHVRKRMIYEKCDAALIMPGGYGTLDEMFEIITWNQLKIHNKKIIILNSGGFYDHLINHLYKMENEGFLMDKISDKISIIDNPTELLEILT